MLEDTAMSSIRRVLIKVSELRRVPVDPKERKVNAFIRYEFANRPLPNDLAVAAVDGKHGE